MANGPSAESSDLQIKAVGEAHPGCDGRKNQVLIICAVLEKVSRVGAVQLHAFEVGIPAEDILPEDQLVHGFGDNLGIVVFLVCGGTDFGSDPVQHIGFVMTAHVSEMPAAVVHADGAGIGDGNEITKADDALLRNAAKAADLGSEPFALILRNIGEFPGDGVETHRLFLHVQKDIEIALCKVIDLRRIVGGYHLFQCVRIRNLVQIAEQNDVILLQVLQLVHQMILLKIITPVRKRLVRDLRRILLCGGIDMKPVLTQHVVGYDDIINPREKRRKHLLVLLKAQLLRLAGEGPCRFLNDETVHAVGKDVETQIQNIQFVKKRDAVIDHAYSSRRGFFSRKGTAAEHSEVLSSGR